MYWRCIKMVNKPKPNHELLAELKKRSAERDAQTKAMYESMTESQKQYIRRLADDE